MQLVQSQRLERSLRVGQGGFGGWVEPKFVVVTQRWLQIWPKLHFWAWTRHREGEGERLVVLWIVSPKKQLRSLFCVLKGVVLVPRTKTFPIKRENNKRICEKNLYIGFSICVFRFERVRIGVESPPPSPNSRFRGDGVDSKHFGLGTNQSTPLVAM